MRASILCAMMVVSAALAACSASGKPTDFEQTGGASSTASGSGVGGAPTTGPGPGPSSGVFSGSVGAGASDGGIPDANVGDGACEAIGQEAKSELQPADIIFAID